MKLFYSAILLSILLPVKTCFAQSANLLCFQKQQQNQTNFPSNSIYGHVNEFKQFDFSSNNNGNNMRRIGKIMIIAGGVFYLIGGLTAMICGDGNLKTGTIMYTTGAVVF